MLVDLAAFPLQEQPKDSLIVAISAISRAWYNGSYTMAAKGRTIRKVMGGMGKKPKKIHARENANEKNSCKEEGKEKNSCRRKVQL